MKTICNNVINIGVKDLDIDLFEGQYVVPNGMLYNSYIVLDDQVTIFDSVDTRFSDEWLGNIEKVLEGKEPSFLVVQHMESDHSGSIIDFLEKYPNAKVVANEKTFKIMLQFFGELNFAKVIVKDGEELNTGNHTFRFVFAPMVHWPEVMLTYDTATKILFSADAFGTFGANDEMEYFTVSEWAEEASRYFIGIVGKFGNPVQALLNKSSTLKIEKICPLHGPVLSKNLSEYIKLYDTWSSYKSEKDGIVIAYASIYGHTKIAAERLQELLISKGQKVVMFDLARCDIAKAISESFRYSKLIIASSTYNADVFPCVRTFIHGLVERNFQNKFMGLIENGSWAPFANKVMAGMFEKSLGLEFAENSFTIFSALNEKSIESLEKLAEEMCE